MHHRGVNWYILLPWWDGGTTTSCSVTISNKNKRSCSDEFIQRHYWHIRHSQSITPLTYDFHLVLATFVLAVYARHFSVQKSTVQLGSWQICFLFTTSIILGVSWGGSGFVGSLWCNLVTAGLIVRLVRWVPLREPSISLNLKQIAPLYREFCKLSPDMHPRFGVFSWALVFVTAYVANQLLLTICLRWFPSRTHNLRNTSQSSWSFSFDSSEMCHQWRRPWGKRFLLWLTSVLC